MCLAGTVVASWSLTQEVAGSSPFTVNNFFCYWIRWIQWKTFRKNSIMQTETSPLHSNSLKLKHCKSIARDLETRWWQCIPIFHWLRDIILSSNVKQLKVLTYSNACWSSIPSTVSTSYGITSIEFIAFIALVCHSFAQSKWASRCVLFGIWYWFQIITEICNK